MVRLFALRRGTVSAARDLSQWCFTFCVGLPTLAEKDFLATRRTRFRREKNFFPLVDTAARPFPAQTE